MKNLSTLMLLLSIIFALSACGDDKEKDEPNPVFPPQTEIQTTINGHEYVDMGLSVKWATTNIGASTPEDYGGYYAWGEIDEKENYTQKTYKYYKGSSYMDIGTDICGTRYDVAHTEWGAPWRMPTPSEFEELEKSCKKELLSLNGVAGCRYTAKNGNSIFLPMAGWKMYTTADDKGVDFAFWCGSKDNIRTYANLFSYKKTLLGIRYLGLSVRAVAD